MTRVDLRWNQLTVFEQGVFKNILQQMMKAQQPFACGCDIAWLIRDNRHLLPVVLNGSCAQDSQFPSVAFGELDPKFFSACPRTEDSPVPTWE